MAPEGMVVVVVAKSVAMREPGSGAGSAAGATAPEYRVETAEASPVAQTAEHRVASAAALLAVSTVAAERVVVVAVAAKALPEEGATAASTEVMEAA